MQFVFVGSAALIFICYLGYPALLWLWGRWRQRPVRKAAVFPTVSIILAVRDGRSFLPRKIRNLLALDYPEDKFNIIVVRDGKEGAPASQASYRSPRLRWFSLGKQSGKATALNSGAALAYGEILVFTDVRQTLAADSLRRLVANFNDPEVGAVTGELLLAEQPAAGEAHALGLYYGYEQWMRRQESRIHSTVGGTGALLAVRRELFKPLPPELILDDVYTPMQAVLGGYRCVLEPGACAYDPRDDRPEFRRKIRNLLGNYQLLQLCPALLSSKNPIWLQYVCHKLTRLAVPFALLGLLVSSVYLSGPVFGTALAAQLGFYVFALSCRWWARLPILARMAELSHAFLMANCAAFLSLYYFLRDKRDVWV